MVGKKMEMGRWWRCTTLVFHFIILTGAILKVESLTGVPLQTSSRWIVNQDGKRVKLACVNWVSHLDAVVAEGLSKQPVNLISYGIKAMGFNCVRLTWPILLVTNDSLSSLSVRQSFQNLGLLESIAGFQINNPSFIDLSLIQAFQVYSITSGYLFPYQDYLMLLISICLILFVMSSCCGGLSMGGNDDRLWSDVSIFAKSNKLI